MNYEEALEWLSGKRSMTNLIPQDPFETWAVRIAQADFVMMGQAYWVVKAHREGLIPTPQVSLPPPSEPEGVCVWEKIVRQYPDGGMTHRPVACVTGWHRGGGSWGEPKKGSRCPYCGKPISIKEG